jgi:hypothetical protein
MGAEMKLTPRVATTWFLGEAVMALAILVGTILCIIKFNL